MEDQSSWKGHTFTLMIFGGIVVLCAIFFVLGMLVGRMQGSKLTTVATAEAGAKITAGEPQREESPELRLPEPAPAKPENPSPRVAPKTEDPPRAATVIGLQVAALKKQREAEKQLSDLKRKGF